MFFTINPMVNLGKYQVKLLSDGWTAVTAGKSLSAQCEHSIGVTETGRRFSRPRRRGCSGRPRPFCSPIGGAGASD